MRTPSAPASLRELPSPVPPDALDTLITPERAARYRQVLARRTGRLVVVLEDCYDPHNATAVLRTCDAVGVQEVHVTTARNAFRVNPRISQGSHRYLELHVHRDIGAAIGALRARGFRVLATDLAADAAVGPSALVPQLDVQPLALLFGNEGAGISDAARAAADGAFRIPMLGFSQSLNLSVTVAVTLYRLRERALVEDLPGDLPPERQIAVYRRWVEQHKPAGAAAIRQREIARNGEELEVFRATQAP